MAKYTPDRAGIRGYLQHDRDLRATLHKRALLGLSAASAVAPRRTGALSTSGSVQDDGPNGGVNGDRMQYSIHFTVRHAVPVTFPQRPKDPTANDYLELAVAVIERGR